MLDQALPIAEQVGGVTLMRVLLGVAWSETYGGHFDSAQEVVRRAQGIDISGHELAERSRLLSLQASLSGLPR